MELSMRCDIFIGENMLQHEFLMMELAAIPEDIDYPFYRENKANREVIREVFIVKDKVILRNARFFRKIETKHWTGTLWMEAEGLDYYGITLLTEESIRQMLDRRDEFKSMRTDIKDRFLNFCKRAEKKNLCIVHLGV